MSIAVVVAGVGPGLAAAGRGAVCHWRAHRADISQRAAAFVGGARGRRAAAACCRSGGAGAPEADTAARGRGGTGTGIAAFWTLLYLGAGRRILALRNEVEARDDGTLLYNGLTGGTGTGAGEAFTRERIPVNPGEGFGQFCRLTPDAEARVLTHYKSVAGVLGQSNCGGVDVVEAADIEPLLAQLLSSSREGCPPATATGGPILSDADVEGFEEVKNYRMPLGLENNFKIHVCPMRSAEELRQYSIPQMKRLSFGLPSPCDIFRGVSFTGCFHGLGIVPAIKEQQFVCGSSCEGTWVRFDKGDLGTYDHDLVGLPMLDDGQAIFFPVTHLWVDFDFPTAAYALEWFFGTRCIVRKKLSLWPMPNALFKQIMRIAIGNLERIS